jgi:hypothetical protein
VPIASTVTITKSVSIHSLSLIGNITLLASMRSTSLLILELLILGLGSTTISRCHGRRGSFFSIRRSLQVRGGAASFYDYDNGAHGDSDLPPDLPSDLPPGLPNYGDGGDMAQRSRQQQQPVERGTQDQYQYNSQQQQQQQQGYGEQGPTDPRYAQQQSQYYNPQQNEQYGQQQPPPGAYGVDHGRGPPSLPSSYGQGQYPSLPEDPSMFEEGEPENMGIDSAFGGGDSDHTGDSTGMDLSAFDKEYILKGLAKLYKKKILPLELSSRYGHFHSPPLSPADFVAPPLVLLLGQYR